MAGQSGPAAPPRRLTLLVREECGLCEEFLEGLQALGATLPLPPLDLVDVDSDPVLRRRYGLSIPVLLLDGERVGGHRLDPDELRRALGAR